MDAESYLHWLGRTDLDVAAPGDVLAAVRAVLSALASEAEADGGESSQGPSEMVEALRDMEEALTAGEVPLDLLMAFRNHFLYDLEQIDPPEVVLEQELREIASGISAERWRTETYDKLENAVDAFLDGGEETALWAAVDELEELMERVSQSYRNTAILPKEVTLESKVTHRLLCEGIDEWQAALASLRETGSGSEDGSRLGEDGTPEDGSRPGDEPAGHDEDGGEDGTSEPDWDEVLKRAQKANRLLVAVQIYHSRLQSALTAY